MLSWMLTWFSVITGVISLVSFGLQVSPAFAKQEAAIRAISWWMLGASFGGLFAFMQKIDVSFSVGIIQASSIFPMILVIIQISCFISAIYLLVRPNREDIRGNSKEAPLIAGGVLLLVSLILFAGYRDDVPEASRVTAEEVALLMDRAEAAKNYTRAKELAYMLKGKVSGDDSVQRRLDAKIKQLTNMQLPTGLPQ